MNHEVLFAGSIGALGGSIVSGALLIYLLKSKVGMKFCNERHGNSVKELQELKEINGAEHKQVLRSLAGIAGLVMSRGEVTENVKTVLGVSDEGEGGDNTMLGEAIIKGINGDSK